MGQEIQFGYWSGQFSSGCRSSGSSVCYKIGQSRICLMSNTGDNRNPRFKNGSHHCFFIKGPEIFNRTTPTTNNQDIQIIPLVSSLNISNHLTRCAFTLNLGRVEHNLNTREASAHRCDNIANHGPTLTGDDPDLSWKLWQSLLPPVLKEPFFGQLFLELLKLDGQGPYPIWLSLFNDNGITPTWLIELNATDDVDLHAFF